MKRGLYAHLMLPITSSKGLETEIISWNFCIMLSLCKFWMGIRHVINWQNRTWMSTVVFANGVNVHLPISWRFLLICLQNLYICTWIQSCMLYVMNWQFPNTLQIDNAGIYPTISSLGFFQLFQDVVTS